MHASKKDSMLQVLYQAVDKLLEGVTPSQLMIHALQMSERYREGVPHDRQKKGDDAQKGASASSGSLTPREAFRKRGEKVLSALSPSASSPVKRELQTEMEYLAYLVVRQPATFAATQKVLQELRRRIVKPSFSRVLDVGSGPGTALWALSENFDWKEATGLELQRMWIDLADRLWQDHPQELSVEWKLGDVASSAPSSQSYDLVMASYCLNELEKTQPTIDALWSATSQVLVWIEPGRSDCFEKMRAFRERVIASGEAVILAPCTGQGRCPFSPIQDEETDPDDVPLDDAAWQTFSQHHVGPGWCHFSVRLERRALHRALKQGMLSYEDEKFCYLIVARKGAVELQEPPASRIMEDPKVRSGHVKMALCDSHHLREEVVTKKDKDSFRMAKKSKGGDLWPPLLPDGGEEA